MNLQRHGDDNNNQFPNFPPEHRPESFYNTKKQKIPTSGKSLKEHLLSLRETGSKLVQEGRLLEGIGCYSSMFNLFKTMGEPDGIEFIHVFHESMEELNKIAMKYIQNNDTESGHQILTFCEECTQAGKYGTFPLLRTKTFNNIACLYRRVNKPKGALNYLRSALTMLGKNNLMKYSAVTYLNLSAVQSQLGDHQQALVNAKNALIYAQEELLLDKEQLQEDRDKLKEKVVTLAIAYHNMGSEEEHLNNLKNAVGWYEKSFLVMDEYQIGDEKLYKKFQTIHLAVLDKLTISEMQGTKRNFSPLSKRSRHSISAKDAISSSFTDYSPTHSPIRPQNQPKRGSVDVHHHRKPTPQSATVRMKKSRSQQKDGKPGKPIIIYSNFSNVYPASSQPISRPSSTTSMSRHNIIPFSQTHAGAFQNSLARSPIKASPEKQTAHSAGFSPGDAITKSPHNFDPDISPSHDSSRHLLKSASDADEIKVLEDMGILEWSDSDTESKRQKIDKDEIKKNQKNFFAHLKDANVKNLSGQFKLMTSSSSASSSSSRSSSEKRKKKKKDKKAKKQKKEKEEKDKSKNKSKIKDSKEKKNTEEIDEDLVEDIKEASSLSLISDQIDLGSANRSKLNANKSGEKTITKLGQEIKSPPGTQKRVDAGIMSKGTRLSVADKSKFGGMQSFSYINPNMQSQGVFTEESDAGEGDQGVIAPPVKLTKEQLKAQAKEREEAAILIQKNYKGKLARDRTKVLKEYKDRMGGKYLIQKRWLLLKPKKTVGKKTVDAETHDYSLNVLVDPQTEQLLFFLNDCSEKVKYDLEVSYADQPLRKTEKTTSLINHKILSLFADKIVKRFMIVDHLLLLAEAKEEEEEDQKEALQKFSTFGEGKAHADRSSDASSDRSKKAKKNKPGHYNQHADKIIKIQSHIRAYLQREIQKLRQEQRWKFLYKQVTRFEDQLISFKLMQNVWEKRYFVTAMHMVNNKSFEKLEVPPKLIDSLHGNYNQLFNKFEFDFTSYVIRFMPAVEAQLFPEARKKQIAKYEVDVIIKIQRNIRRYLARQTYKLMLKRARKNPTMKLLKKYRITKHNAVFSVLMYYNTEYNSFVVHAKVQGYLAQIKPLNISVGEVDKYDLRTNMANIRRLNDIIQPYITIDKTRENMYLLNFNKKDYERKGRQFETQLMSYTDLDILGEHREGDDLHEVHNKVWKFLQDKNFLETNQHILKNIMGLQSVSDSVKIMEELEPSIKQLGKAENNAATKIQRKYRKWTFKKNCEVLVHKQHELMNQKSISTLISNSVREKTYSMFSRVYQRLSLTDEQLKMESNAGFVYVKTVSDVSFRNTPLEAKIHVFHNKRNPKERTIDLEIIIPIIGLQQYIQIPENQILSKASSFFKKVDENVLSRLLEFDEKHKWVFFNHQAKSIGDSEVFDNYKNEINPYVQAKLARLKYLKRRMREKFMLFLKVETVRVGDYFVHMTYYWHLMRRQLRIMLQQIDNLTYEKEIVVKFDSLYNSSELRGLVNDLNIQPNEFVRKINPYLLYISSHITIQPGTEANGREFGILIDTSVLQLVFSNSKFVLTSFRDMSSTILNDIATSGTRAVQAHLKYLSKTAKMTDVREFEKKFTKKARFVETGITRTESVEKPMEVEQMETSFTKQKSIFIHEIPQRDLAAERKKATLTIQKMVRGYFTRQMYNFKKLGKKLQGKRAEVSGYKLKKTIKKIDNQYWTITISKKTQHDVGVSIYYFTAVNVSDNAKKTKTVAKGHFRTNNMILVNAEGKDLAEFLLERIEINGQTIEFNLNIENASNYVKIEPATKNQDYIRTIEPEEEVKEVHAPPQTKEAGGATGAAGAAGESFGSNQKIAPPPDKNFLIPMAMNAKGGDANLPKPESQPKITHADNLLQQKAESILNNLLLYNVYYNQDQSSLDSVISPLIRDPQNTPEDVKALLREGTHKKKGNTVKIDVELAELKKYLPHLAPKSIQDLKQIAGELANSIQINEKGEVLVNHAKLNPNVLSVLEKKLGVIENKDLKSPEKNKNSKKKVLDKMTKAYGEKKYLLLINYIEKLSTINDVLTLTGREEDQVYEDFEMFLEISALCLSNSTLPPLIWELPLQEAQRLSGQTNHSEVSKFFVNNLHIYGDRFLLVTRSKVHAHNSNVISMNEKVIKILQNKFRSRKFISNFKRFKETLNSLKHKMITRAMISISSISYHVFGFDKSGSELEVELWDLQNYEKYNLVIPKKIVEKLYSKDKKAAFDSIFKFLAFEIDKKKGYGVVLKEKELLGYLSKHKWN